VSGAHRGPGRLARLAFWTGAARARPRSEPWPLPLADPWATWNGEDPPPPEEPLPPLPDRRPADCVVWPACACPGPDCPATRHPWPGATDPRD
jgi:hypothetical protein